MVVANKIHPGAVAAKKKTTPWHAGLTLDFERRGARTVLASRHHTGPLLVQHPFYPEGPVCHVYLIHPPGGVVGGDVIEMDINCRPGAEVLITTPAAGKFYRSNGAVASQTIRLDVAENSALEWFPQETIFFDGALAECRTRVNLDRDARFFGWEILVLGRPACQETFLTGRALINLELWQNSKPMLLERMLLNSETIGVACGLMDHPLVATLLIHPANQANLDQVRNAAKDYRFFGATLTEKLLVCRLLGHQAEPARRLFASIWKMLRPALSGRAAESPRIWAT